VREIKVFAAADTLAGDSALSEPFPLHNREPFERQLHRFQRINTHSPGEARPDKLGRQAVHEVLVL
jgi:hypothetical protein